MAIQQINTLQNKDNYNNIAKEYILESLANLGQRYSVQGDSISIDSFSFDKLINITSLTEEERENSIIVVKENEIYLCGKNSQGNWDTTRPIDELEGYRISLSDNVLELSSLKLNNNPSIVYTAVNFKVTDDLYYDFCCRQDYNTKLNKTNFIIERYDKNSSKLIEGVKIFKTHFNSFCSDRYLLINVTLQESGNYKLRLYVSSVDINSISDTDLYNLISNYSFNGSVSFGGLFINALNRTSVICEYDNYKIIASSELLSILDNPTDEEILQNQLLYSFTDDSKNLFVELKEKYCNTIYGKIDSIFIEVLESLYNTIKVEEESSLNALYIPLVNKDGSLYSISYTYNTNKPDILYFSGKEIEVRFVESNIDSDWLDNNFEDYKGTIIAHTENCERVTFYYFESSLNELGSYVENIWTKKISTLPYIDKNGYWVINDITTEIRASGRDAGNPNIVIVETTNKENGYNIISGALKKELLETLEWKTKIAKVEPLERINLDNLSFKNEFDYFSVCCTVPDTRLIPEINKRDYLSKLENAIIICISPVSCINYDNSNNTDNINYTRDDVIEIYGEYGIITTIWTLNDEYEFDYLRKRNNEYAAADFNYLSNINNLIQYAVKNHEPLHPDNYEFTRLVFDSINTSLKNNTSENISYIYPNLVNKLSSQYNISNYNNDVNFTFKANNTIIRSNEGRNIEHLSQGNEVKYYNATYNTSELNSANVVTNSLYTYNENRIQKKYNEYIPNYNVPSLDLGEVITRNETLLNRLNILSFNSQGTAYLSYIGTSFENDKNVLTIGTSNTNINMSTDTLIAESDRNSFTKQDKLEVNLNTVNINGETSVSENLNVNKNIYLNGTVWTKNYTDITTQNTINKTTYYTGIITPTARYIYELNDNQSRPIDNKSIPVGQVTLYPSHGETYSFTERNDETGTLVTYFDYVRTPDSYTYLSPLLEESIYEWSLSNNKLYTINTAHEFYTVNDQSFNYKIYFSDGIYLPVLVSQLGLSKYIKINDEKINTKNIVATSNMEIITVNENPIMLVSTSTNLYPDKYVYGKLKANTAIGDDRDYNVEKISNFTYTMFTANPIKITYYTNGSKLYIHLEELYSKNKFTPTKKLKQNYII